MPELRVRLLGTPLLAIDDTPISITRRKVLALLVYLAATGEAQRRETLAALLWPESDATSAYAYLRNALWLVRQTPVADWFDADQELVGFSPDKALWVDVVAVEQCLDACRRHGHPPEEVCERCVPLLDQAVRLHRGDFLAGFTLGDSAAFDDWQFFRTEELRQAMAQALRKLVAWHSRPANLETAIAYAQHWQSLDPLHEEAARCLMVLYAQNDQRATALHVYDALTSALRAQGLSPSDETVSLYRQLRAGHIPPTPEQQPATTGTTAVAPPGAAAQPLPSGTVTFLFTDIEGSVALWDRRPESMKDAVALHHAIVREQIETSGGVVFKVVGDAFQAAFSVAAQAVAAGVAIQRALAGLEWGDHPPLRVRIGIHTGPAELLTGPGAPDYEVSHTLNRAARIMSAGHGGQILLTHEAAALVQDETLPSLSLRDLGEHNLRGLSHPQRIFQVIGPDLREDFPALATTVRPRHNLPASAASFVGRTAELTELKRLLGDPETRLITLTGPGGIGKTRLALRLAESALESFTEGVAFVSLAAVRTPERAVEAVIDALGLVLYQHAAVSPLAQLVSYLHDRSLLMVLDNCEQIEKGAELVSEILAQTRCPKLVVTSRHRLNLRGEWALELEGLPCPDDEGAGRATTYGAVQLFLDRMRHVRGDLAAEGDMAAVVRICRLVHGMPLGLELAAAWTRLLSCAEVADEINRNLDFLTQAMADLPERHRSLRAVFDHSWALLSPEERACYSALSLFRGGFTRQAATEVAGTSLPLLASLIDASMLRRTASGRFEVLEVLRQYAEEQLATDPPRWMAAADRHCTFYLGMLRRLEPALKGAGRDAAYGQLAALDSIHADIGNIRAAWRWAIAQRRTANLHAAAVSLALYCDIRSRFRDGLELFGEAIAAFDRETGTVAVSASFLGLLYGIQGEWVQRLSMSASGEVCRRALDLVDRGGATPERALVNVLCVYGRNTLGPELMQQRLEESLAIYEAHGDDWGTALTLAVMGESLDLAIEGDRGAAKLHSHQALTLRQRIGDHWGSAMSLFTLGSIALMEGAFREARRHFRESLEARQTLRDNYGVAHCARNLGYIAYRLGDPEEAERLLDWSLAVLNEIGIAHGAAEALEILAAMARDKGDFTKAHTCMREARQKRLDANETNVSFVRGLLQLGEDALALGDADEAQGYFRESLAAAERSGYVEGAEAAAEKLMQDQA